MTPNNVNNVGSPKGSTPAPGGKAEKSSGDGEKKDTNYTIIYAAVGGSVVVVGIVVVVIACKLQRRKTIEEDYAVMDESSQASTNAPQGVSNNGYDKTPVNSTMSLELKRSGHTKV